MKFHFKTSEIFAREPLPEEGLSSTPRRMCKCVKQMTVKTIRKIAFGRHNVPAAGVTSGLQELPQDRHKVFRVFLGEEVPPLHGLSLDVVGPFAPDA